MTGRPAVVIDPRSAPSTSQPFMTGISRSRRGPSNSPSQESFGYDTAGANTRPITRNMTTATTHPVTQTAMARPVLE